MSVCALSLSNGARLLAALMGKRRSGVSAWGLRPENYLLPLDKSGWSRDFREDLKIKNMTASAKGTVEEPGSRVAQKSGLNGSILDQGWGIFFSKLDWKTLRLGGHVHKVPPQNTSRTCPICGSVSKDNRKTQALFKCVSCGHQGNADVIAAINIKERGRSSLACGESEKNAWAQVNSGRPKKQMPNQQQESTEVISSASY